MWVQCASQQNRIKRPTGVTDVVDGPLQLDTGQGGRSSFETDVGDILLNLVQAGDVGAGVTDAMGRQAPEGLLGIHTNLLVTALGDPASLPSGTEQERAALAAIGTFSASGNGYFVEQATRPQTIGYALLDSPIALAAWIMDHDTDSYQKIARALVDGQPSGNLTRETIVDNITLYWVTGTGASAARSYWEEGQENARAAGQAPTPVSIPVGFTTFPGEIWRTPRS